MKKLFSNKYFYAIASFIISSYVLLVFVKSPGINGYERAMFSEMVYGTAWKPFVYRTLLPSAVRLVTSIIPENTKQDFSYWAENNSFAVKVLSKFKWESKFITEYIIAMIFMLSALIGFVYAYKYLFIAVQVCDEWFTNLSVLVTLSILPVMFQYYSYLYDFLLLFLFTLALGLMIREKWVPFIIVYLISCFNKETTILLTLIFWIYFFKKENFPGRLFVQLLSIQFSVFVIIKIILFFVFKNNPGTFVEFHLIDHNLRIFNGFTINTFGIWFGFILLIAYRWNEKPKFLRDAVWIIVPLLISAFFLGFIDELRDYYEVYPVIAMLIAFGVGKIMGVQIKEKLSRITEISS